MSTVYKYIALFALCTAYTVYTEYDFSTQVKFCLFDDINVYTKGSLKM